MSTNDLFRDALLSSGMPYLHAEAKLRDDGTNSSATLRSHLNATDEIEKLLAKTLLDWIEGRAPDNDPALEYLRQLPGKISRTAMGVPSPMGAADYLHINFGPRVADILALRLVKENDWPHWKVMAILFYLQKAKAATATGALIRFAADTKNEEWRDAAIDALKDTKDPELPGKLRREQERLKADQRTLPEALGDLMSPT